MTSQILNIQEIDKIKIVKKEYLKGFIGSFLIVLIGLLTSAILNHYAPLNQTIIGLLQAFSVVPGSAALFGVQDWEIKSWGGKTPAEVLNRKYFKILSTIGLFFAVVAFSLTIDSAPNP